MVEIEIGSRPLSMRAVLEAGAPGTHIRLSEDARQRVVAARAVIERYAAGSEPIYGLNTGLGGNIGHRLCPSEIEAFQVQLVRGRCIGMGEPFPQEVARTALLCRIIGLAQGGSGVSPGTLDHLVAMFNAGITPVIPSRGSIGAADLGLCAHLAAAALGLGEAFHQGRRPATEALRQAGLAPAALKPKDGLSLCNASAVSCGHAVHVLAELADCLTIAAVTAALAGEGYAANSSIFDARLADARPARGQQLAAAMFRALLAGSYLHDPGAPRSIQDALSFRVLSQIYGPVLETFRTAVESVEAEINAAADNPLVLAEDGLILATANFHTPAIALAFDTLAIALTHLATAGFYRITKLMNAQLSGLPKYLSPVGGASTGFNSLQKTAAALHAEIRLKATPASLDALPVSDAVEDHAPHTPLTIRKLDEQLAPLWFLVAIEAMIAAQAVDLRGKPRLASVTGRLYEAIRAQVPMLTEDRETGPDAGTVHDIIRSPTLIGAVRQPFTELGVPIALNP
jgi:histidine ammonia-lyase